jgi:lipoprotein signal peptidase
VTQLAKVVTIEMESGAFEYVPLILDQMINYHAKSLMLKDVELDIQFGMKTDVTVTILFMVVNSGEPFGTLNAGQAGTISVAASAHVIAPLL